MCVWMIFYVDTVTDVVFNDKSEISSICNER